MFDHILMPLEGGHHDSEVATTADILSRRWGAGVEVVSVLAHGEDTAEREAQIARQVAMLGHRPKLTVRYVTYSVADSIADEFDDQPDTLIVMGTAARSRSGAMIESVAEAVLEETRAPVLLVGPHATVGEDWPTGDMFVCTDGSAESEIIVDDAARWADALDLQPWVITAADPGEIPTGIGSDFVETGHVSRVARKIGSITGREAQFDVVHDPDPAEGIVRYVNDHDASLIAVATQGRKGWSRLVHGSVAMSIVHDAPCPVLARLES